ENQYEISQHKADLAMQMRTPVEQAVGSEQAPAPPVRPVAALRFRGGSRTATRPPALQMVGVVDLNGDALPPTLTEAAPSEPPAVEVSVAMAEPVAVMADKGPKRRGKRGGRKHKVGAA